MKKIEIEIPDCKRAEWVNGVLTLVDDKPKDVTERIKTFEDAVKELGDEHHLVRRYKALVCDTDAADIPVTNAFYKLRIVCTALNEGWTPKFTKSEWLSYPWFNRYLKDDKDLEYITDEVKEQQPMIDVSGYGTEYVAFSFTGVKTKPLPYMRDYLGSRLCFKNSDLATYCGKQFINLWADYLLRIK